MLDWLTIVASTTLLGASENVSPAHNFSHQYHDGYSSTTTTSGTHFYTPKYPEITLQGLTHIRNTGLIWGVTSPFVSEKYARGWNLSATLYHDFVLHDVSRIRLSASLSSYAAERASPCVDSLGRRFHCYHGTQSSSPYFTHAYHRVENEIYRDDRYSELNSVAITWIAIF